MNYGIAGDTIRTVERGSAGIPDIGTRVIVLVSGVFVLSILFVLIYFRMTEVEEGDGSS